MSLGSTRAGVLPVKYNKGRGEQRSSGCLKKKKKIIMRILETKQDEEEVNLGGRSYGVILGLNEIKELFGSGHIRGNILEI